METSEVISAEDAKQMIGGISVQTVYHLMDKGNLAYRQVGRRRFPLRQSVVDYIAANTHQATTQPVAHSA